MANLANLVQNFEKWTSRNLEEPDVSSSSSQCIDTKYKPCSWSSYFAESVEKDSNPDTNKPDNSVSEYVHDKVSFNPRKARELVKLVNEEIAKISRGFGDVQSINWVSVAEQMSKHANIFSPRDCYIQYNNVESMKINKHVFLADEDRKLLALVNEYEECGWIKIADELGTNRTPLQCLQRYQQALNKRLVNSNDWTKEEDLLLRKAAEMFGTKNWQNVANTLSGRTAVQCGSRYRKSAQCRDDIVDGSWLEIDERRYIYYVFICVCVNNHAYEYICIHAYVDKYVCFFYS
jgi:hypothetical protein